MTSLNAKLEEGAESGLLVRCTIAQTGPILDPPEQQKCLHYAAPTNAVMGAGSQCDWAFLWFLNVVWYHEE